MYPFLKGVVASVSDAKEINLIDLSDSHHVAFERVLCSSVTHRDPSDAALEQAQGVYWEGNGVERAKRTELTNLTG